VFFILCFFFSRKGNLGNIALGLIQSHKVNAHLNATRLTCSQNVGSCILWESSGDLYLTDSLLEQGTGLLLLSLVYVVASPNFFFLSSPSAVLGTGLSLSNGRIFISRTVFSRLTAMISGACLTLSIAGYVHMRDSFVIDNFSPSLVVTNSGFLTFYNVTFLRNSGGEKSGFYITGGNVVIDHCFFDGASSISSLASPAPP
jgi:hypothetical protein